MKCSASALGLLSAALTISTADAAPAPAPPPYTGAYQPRGVDEIGWWREDDESEQKLAASNLVIRDEKLNAYVENVLCDTVGVDRCKSVRVYILREPTFNATMSPNGTMRVYSGLLLRVRNEAELGAILGHEFGHFEKRHTVQQFKSARSATDVLAWASVLASMAPTYDMRRTYQDVELSIYGSFLRYNRNQEREADVIGIGYLNQSQLRPHEASTVWKNLMAEMSASARVKGVSKPNFNSVAFTASHPPHGERAAYLHELARPEAISREDGRDRYSAALASWLPIFLEDQVKLNDFGASEYLIESLAQNGWTAWLWHARGELYRGRGAPRDLVHAAEFYARAVALDLTLAEAQRGLGLSLLKNGRGTEGHEALRRYLQLKPDAADAKLISMMLPKEVTQK